MERKLSALGETAEQDQPGEKHIPVVLMQGLRLQNRREIADEPNVFARVENLARRATQHDQPDYQRQRAAAGDEKRLERAFAGFRLFRALETNEHEGRDARQFPGDEEHEEVAGEHDRQHCAGESRQPDDESIVLRRVVKVVAGVEENQRADAADDQAKEEREAIEIERQADAGRRQPRDGLLDRALGLDAGQRAQEPGEERRHNQRRDDSPGRLVKGRSGDGRRQEKREAEGECREYR